jgi:phage tail-like protein
MSRGLVPGLATPHPIGPTLPGIFQGDDFAGRLVAAFDEVLAPVFVTLDDFPAYLDPGLAPEDFLDWLGGWVGADLDHTWPLDRRRALAASAVELFRMRGTASGLAAHAAIFTGGDVEIIESGAAGFSSVPNASIPGDPSPNLLVRVTVTDPATVSMPRLEALIASAKPAHVPHRIEVVKA